MQQNETPLIRALTLHYDKVGILSTNFRCKHLAECQGCLPPTPSDATDPEEIRNTFTQAKSAFVGDRYGDVAPRLLFVSLDPGRALKTDSAPYNYIARETRTPQGVQKGNASVIPFLPYRVDGRKWQRLLRTNELAERILRDKIPQESHVMRFYAHANAAKCTMNKKGSVKANNRLYDNCRKRNYLRGEIDILAPDIIVSMGKEAMEGVEHALPTSHGWERVGCEKEVELSGGRRALWLPIHHTSHPDIWPEAREKWGNGEGHEWEKFADRVREFISKRDS